MKDMLARIKATWGAMETRTKIFVGVGVVIAVIIVVNVLR